MSQDHRFVNRYGHEAKVAGKDLVELHIDDETVKLNKKKPLKLKRARRKMRRWQKYTLIIVGLCLIAVPVVTGEIVRYNYEQSSASTVQQLKDLVSSTVLPQQKKSTLTSKELQIVNDKIKQLRDSICQGGLLDNMASLYPRSKKALDDCLAVRGKFATLSSALDDLTAQLAYLEQLKPLFGSVTAPAEEQYAVLASQQENWKSLSDGLKTLSPPTSLKTDHEALQKAVGSVVSEWTNLLNANSEQDGTKFSATEKKLNDNYTSVRASAESFEKTIAETQTRLTFAQKELL